MPNIVEILITAKDTSHAAMKEAKDGWMGLGKAALGVGVTVGTALVALGAKSVEMASKFDAEITKLNTQAGVSKDKLAGLSKGVLDLAGQVGQNPDSLAEALFHVESNFSSLGITSDKALSLLKVAAKGASVGGADLVDVTNALTAAVASGIPGVEDFDKAMGVLNATVGAGDMTMQDLASAMGTGFLATVKGFGLSIKDVGAALATFGDNNIRGAKAGTQLRMTVEALAQPAKTAGVWLDKFGMTADTLAKDMSKGGLLKALVDLKDRMDKAGISANDQGKVLTDMFGKKAGVGINILVDQLDRLKSKYPDLTKGANNFADAWETTKKTLKQQFADIRAGWDAELIKIGEGATPILEGLINKFFEFGKFLDKTFSGLDIGDKLKKSMGQEGPQLIKDLDGAFKGLEDAIHRNRKELATLGEWIAIALGIALKTLPLVMHSWSFFIDAIGAGVDMFKLFAKGALAALKLVLDGAIAALSWIPGIGPKLDDARKKFDKFAEGVNKTLDGIHDKNVTVTFSSVYAGDWQTYRAGERSTSGRAHGGIVGAASGMITSGMTWVGERGPELVRLPVGSQVIPHGTSMNMAAGTGHSERSTTEVAFVGNVDSAFASAFQELIRRGLIKISTKAIVP